METVKNIKLKMPDAIDTATYDAMKYKSIESRVAYLKLVSKRGEEDYKSKNKWNDKINKHLIGLINGEIVSLKEDLEEEQGKYKPIGCRFEQETIEIELDMYDTIEEQIEYLKQKLREFDIATMNVGTNEYDDVREYLEQLIVNREKLLYKNKSTKENIKNDKLWGKIVDSNFDPHIINKCLNDVGMQNEDNFIDFMRRKFSRYSVEEWINKYDSEDKIGHIESINSNKDMTDEEKYLRRNEVWERKYLDSNDGKETLGWLKRFEEKYLSKKQDDKAEMEGKESRKDTELKNDFEKYLQYGKECYIKTWQDPREHYLRFSDMMMNKYGQEIDKYIIPVWKFVSGNTSPIAFIGCEINFLENKLVSKNIEGKNVFIEKEIKKVGEYIKDIEKLSFLTSSQNFIKGVDEVTLEKYPEWQVYFIEKMKYKELRELVEYLRINRPGVYDTKYGENYNVDFEWITGFAIDELTKYQDKLKILQKTFNKTTVNEIVHEIKEAKQNTDTAGISNELSNAQGIILRQRNRIKTLEKGITQRELEKLIDDNNCRKKNGKINYSAIGRILGCTHHTAKSKCVFFNIT